jgi:hypothetical protein
MLWLFRWTNAAARTAADGRTHAIPLSAHDHACFAPPQRYLCAPVKGQYLGTPFVVRRRGPYTPAVQRWHGQGPARRYDVTPGCRRMYVPVMHACMHMTWACRSLSCCGVPTTATTDVQQQLTTHARRSAPTVPSVPVLVLVLCFVFFGFGGRA